MGQRLTVHALGFFSKPFHKAGTVNNFALGLGKGFALLGCQDAAQVLGVGDQKLKPLQQNRVAFFAGFFAPGGPGGVGGGNGGFSILRAQVGHVGQLVAVRRVIHVKAGRARDPLAVDQRVGFKQARVI